MGRDTISICTDTAAQREGNKSDPSGTLSSLIRDDVLRCNVSHLSPPCHLIMITLQQERFRANPQKPLLSENLSSRILFQSCKDTLRRLSLVLTVLFPPLESFAVFVHAALCVQLASSASVNCVHFPQLQAANSFLYWAFSKQHSKFLH